MIFKEFLKPKIKRHLISLFLAIFLTLGLSISIQSLLAAWTAPSSNPPDGNVLPPINTSGSGQNKSGYLNVGLLGIGLTNSPEHHLHISDNNINPEIELEVSGNHWSMYHDIPTNDLRFWYGSGGTGDNILTLQANGNLIGREGFGVLTNVSSGVYDDGTSNSPYSRISADSLHTNGLGVGQIFIEGRAIDANNNISIGAGLAGGQSSVNVGIGVENPGAKLEVSGSAYFYPNTTGEKAIALRLGKMQSGGNHLFDIWTDDVGADNVYFDINRWGGHYYFQRSSNNGDQLIAYIGGSDSNGHYFNLYNSTDSSVRVSLNSNGNTYFNGGNIGVGTTNPLDRMHIYANSDNIVWPLILNNGRNSSSVSGYGVGIKLKQSGNSELNKWAGMAAIQETSWSNDTGLVFFTDGNNTEKMHITASGNVGIGITSPGERLDVNGSVRANSFVYSSDKRLKKDIKTIDNALDKILKLEGVSFKWKDKEKGENTNLGLIAQDVEKVFPELVSTDQSDEHLKSVAYGNLVAPLIEAIKAQQKEIEELKKEIEHLKND